MKKDINSRLHELQENFQQMEPEIQDEKVKKALSVMHGMIQEMWRQMSELSTGKNPDSGSIKNISEIYKKAPKMEGEAMNKPLPEGHEAPAFSLKDANGFNVSLSDFRGSPVLLVFYPLDWSPGCSQQLDLYQREITEFEKRGVKVVGISVDSIYSHGAWSKVRNIDFPLLSDFNPKGEVAKMYNVYRETDGFSERALYLVDAEGIIRYSIISTQINHIPDIYALFSKLDEIYRPAITI
jgi:peroxiredoxin